MYHSTVGVTPLEVPLLPIQLIESALLIVLFAVQLYIYLKHKKMWRNTVTYVGTYPVIRFVLEFFRGDTERGIFLGLSTSQWTSLAILAVLCVILFCTRRKKHLI